MVIDTATNENQQIIDFRPLQILIKRRKEAKEMGRLIHPEPFIAAIKKRRFFKVMSKTKTPVGILVNRAGDFLINVAKIVRDPATWESAVAGQIVGLIMSKIIRFK